MPTISMIGPVVVRQAMVRTSASSNDIPNIAKIIVIKAKLTIKSMKKTQAIKIEISRLFKLILDPVMDEG